MFLRILLLRVQDLGVSYEEESLSYSTPKVRILHDLTQEALDHGLHLESYEVITKRNYLGAFG